MVQLGLGLGPVLSPFGLVTSNPTDQSTDR